MQPTLCSSIFRNDILQSRLPLTQSPRELQNSGFISASSQSDALARYAALLLRWNAVHNLTTIETPADVLSHHLLDSLAIVPEVQRVVGAGVSRILDVGAGGGLPGVGPRDRGAESAGDARR